MKTLPTLLTMATLLSIPPAMAGTSAECANPPVTRADAIVDAIEHGSPVRPLIAFRTGSAKLAPNSREQIEELAEALKDYPYLHIEIGIAPDHGVSAKLAHERATALREALLDLDAPAGRVAVREVKGDAEVAELELATGPQQCETPAAGS